MLKNLWNCIKANMYKMIHCGVLQIYIILPILVATIFCVYYRISTMEEMEKISFYFQFIAMMLPLAMTVTVTWVWEKDLNAGGCQILKTIAYNKAIGHLGNAISLLVLYVMGMFLVIAVFAVGYAESGFTWIFYIKVYGMFLAVTFVNYILYYMICYTWGKGISICAGIVGMLLTPLMCLGVGDKMWKIFPCSYSARMVSYFIMINASDKNDIRYEYVFNDYRIGGMMISIITVVFICVFCFWANLWQGEKLSGE